MRNKKKPHFLVGECMSVNELVASGKTVQWFFFYLQISLICFKVIKKQETIILTTMKVSKPSFNETDIELFSLSTQSSS